MKIDLNIVKDAHMSMLEAEFLCTGSPETMLVASLFVCSWALEYIENILKS